MSYSQAFICLSYLFTNSGFEEQDKNEKYTYFKKDGLAPVQINRLKINYSNLELSSYAVRVGQKTDEFIDTFNVVMDILKTREDKSD